MIKLDTETVKKYIRAGKIARKALEKGKRICEEGASYLEIAEAVENTIYKYDAGPAFPTNVSVNSIGAHYTPRANDDKKIEKGDLVKIDVGCHVDGYIADNAATIEVGTNNYASLIKASEEALDIAIKSIRPGIRTRDIGKQIETVIQDRGFNPISNLTGHEVKRYVLHTGTSIPNVPKGWKKIKKGMVLAIEPFATDGHGRVEEGEPGNIYRLRSDRNLEGNDQEFYEWIKEKFHELPFAGRWCSEFSEDFEDLLHRLKRFGVVMDYPILKEKKGGYISQREHTVVVTSKGCRVTTKL